MTSALTIFRSAHSLPRGSSMMRIVCATSSRGFGASAAATSAPEGQQAIRKMAKGNLPFGIRLPSIDRHGVDAVEAYDDAAVALVAHLDRVAADHLNKDRADRLPAHVDVEPFFFFRAALEKLLISL